MREQKTRGEVVSRPRLNLQDFFSRVKDGDAKELLIVLKGDVQGSVEALSDALVKLSGSQVKVRVIHKGVGTINEGDILLAAASNAVVIGFNVRPEPKVAAIAAHEQVDMRFYGIIYQVTEDIKKAMTGLLAPTYKEEVQGRAEVRQLFQVPKIGTIAGCGVLDGKITRSSEVRVIREGIVIYTGKIGSLRRIKDDAREVAAGYECGIGVENYNDLKTGRHPRGLHPGPGRGDPLLGPRGGARGDDRRHLLDRIAARREPRPQGQAQGPQERQGPGAQPLQRLDRRSRRSRRLAALDLGVACVSKDRDQVESTLAHVATFIEDLHLASVESVHTEIL